MNLDQGDVENEITVIIYSLSDISVLNHCIQTNRVGK